MCIEVVQIFFGGEWSRRYRSSRLPIIASVGFTKLRREMPKREPNRRKTQFNQIPEKSSQIHHRQFEIEGATAAACGAQRARQRMERAGLVFRFVGGPGEACRPEEGWQEEDAPGGAGELVELAARGEDDEPDLSIAEHGELEGLLEQPVAALGEGHLPARRVLYPLQLRLPPHHRGRPIPPRLPETYRSGPNPGTLHEQAAPNANQPTNSSNSEVR